MLTIRSIDLHAPTEIQAVEQLYVSSFPVEERVPFEELIDKAILKKGNYFGLFQEEQVCGMIYYIVLDDLLYIFFFAIDGTIQSKGYGKFVLDYMQETFPNKKQMLLIEELDKEADNFEQRMRRKNFYEKNNFVCTGVTIVAANIPYELMSRGKTLATEEECERIYRYFFDEAE